MTRLRKSLVDDIVRRLYAGEDLPPDFKYELFPPDKREYELVYANKKRREDVLADTLGVPLQAIRTFGTPEQVGGWVNRLIFGDNLQAMKALLDDPDVKGKVKFVYIDPPFATKRDFGRTADSTAGYQDKIVAAEFIEFLRQRLILLWELLAPDGSIYVHLDWRRSHYIKLVLDELFGETHFRNEIVWRYSGWNKVLDRNFEKRHDTILFYAKEQTNAFNSFTIPYANAGEYLKTRRQKVYTDNEGKTYTLDTREAGRRQTKIYVDEAVKRGQPVDDVWTIDKINK